MKPLSWLAVLGAFAVGSSPCFGQTTSQPFLSEFLAENTSGLADGDGQPEDWVEIRNPGNNSLALEGHSLSDDPTQPKKWLFPAQPLVAGQSLVVFASGRNLRDRLGFLHTNFRLANDNGFLGLYGKDGQLLSSFGPNYPSQRADVSYGVAEAARGRLAIAPKAACRWFVPKDASLDATWFQPAFEDAAWTLASLGLGSDAQDLWRRFVITDITATASNLPGIYVRIPFEIADLAAVAQLRLRLKVDDGFVAYLNGRRVAAHLAPPTVAWNANAEGPRIDTLVPLDLAYDLTSERNRLVQGRNVLAIHVLNTKNSKDLFLAPLLEVVPPKPSVPVGYLNPPTPQTQNGSAYLGFVKDTKYTVNHGVFKAPVTVALTSETPEAVIRYTTDATEPTEADGAIYTEPLVLSKTTVLRVMATKEDLLPTNVDNQTYLFPADVKLQKDMDTRVVTNAEYAPLIEQALGATLPVVSLTVDRERFFGATGIHTQFDRSGRAAEVPVGVEYFSPIDVADSFRVNAGIRIHGGNARSHPKKPMRLLFRAEYGADKLRFPLFPGSPVDAFDELILRGGGHDGWSLADSFGAGPSDLPPHASFLRDQFLRLTENEMGVLSPKGKYVHLYINGAYWGFYDIHERPAAAYFRDHRGGQKADWDVLHHPEFVGEPYSIADGDDLAWQALQKLAAQTVTSTNEMDAFRQYLDFDSYIDHLTVRMWSGDYDWLSPLFRRGFDAGYFGSKNWYAARRSRNGSGPFHVFVWDAEMSMGMHLLGNLTGGSPPQRVTDFDLTRIDNPNTPATPYNSLRGYEEFQRIFADRVQRNFFGEGALTQAATLARLEGLVKQLEVPVVAESARWGHTSAALLTRKDHWRPEVEWMRTTYLPTRHTEMLRQFRERGLFPATAAPTFAKPAGVIPAGASVDLLVAAGAGTIYYTTDGSDPAEFDKLSRTVWLNEKADADVIVPSATNGGINFGTNWTLIIGMPVPQNWRKGKTGVGYDVGQKVLSEQIGFDISAEMHQKNASVYIRVPFDIQTLDFQKGLERVLLRMKYDDGFIAYINGREVARANAPVFAGWNSAAQQSRADSREALTFENFDITSIKTLLRPGRNILSIHGLNSQANSSDLLMLPRIEAISVLEPAKPSRAAQKYRSGVDLKSSATIKARVFSLSGEWSPLAETHYTVGSGLVAGDLALSEICYKPAPPSATEAALFPSRDEFEFLELTNTTTRELDLTGAAFSTGIRFTFPETALPVGASIVVVRNEAAFRARYGSSEQIRVAGAFENNTKLSDSGETLTLVSAQGQVLLAVDYNDKSPWPTSPDDTGATLVYRPGTKPDPQDPANWTASLDPGGYPGTAGLARYADWRARYFLKAADAIAGPAADPDNDGRANLAEYALGTDPNRGDSSVNWAEFARAPDGQTVLYLRRRPDTLDLTFGVEIGADLKAWKLESLALDAERHWEASGHERVTAKIAEPSARFARIKISQKQ